MKKTNLDKKNFFLNFPKFRNFLKFLSSDIFQMLCEKMFSSLEHISSIGHLHPMQCLAPRNNCCYITKYHSCNLGYNYVHTVSRMVGYCLYGTLLLRPRWTACPLQIKAHHHIDAQTSIIYFIQFKNMKFVHSWKLCHMMSHLLCSY